MPALVAGIHAFLEFAKQDVDARHKAGHDGGEAVRFTRHGRTCPGPKLMVSRGSSTVMAGLVPAIHVFTFGLFRKDVDARHNAGHDGG